MGNGFGIRPQKDDLFYPKRFTLYNEMDIGHTPVTRIGETTLIQKKSKCLECAMQLSKVR
jgi:hypothetical protein